MEGLGIDLKLIVYQLINFLLLVGALTYILHKPLTKLLDKRSEEIKEGLDNAAKAKEALAKATEKQEEMLAEAERKGHALIEEVRLQSKELEKQLEAKAEERAERVLAHAEEEIAAERIRLRTELKGELAEMVVNATGKVLKEAPLGSEKREQIEKIVTTL